MIKFSRFNVLIPLLATLILLPLSPAISADQITWKEINVKDPVKPIELALTGIPTVSNPFDPAQADLWATVVTPNKTQYDVPLFWYQEFRATVNGNTPWSTAVGEPGWRLRFRSDELGIHQVTLRGTINGEAVSAASYSVTTAVKHSSQIKIVGRGFQSGCSRWR